MNDRKFKQLIYDLMIGSVDLQRFPDEVTELVENELENSKFCDKEYDKIFDAKARLCKRLGNDSDKDVECIVDGFFATTRYLCCKMYDYGRLFAGKKDLQDRCREYEDVEEIES